jgi:hypothetical protein
MICIKNYEQRSVAMKRNKGVWITLGIVTVWTLMLVSMIGAQPEHVRPPHQFLLNAPHGFTPWRGHPAPVFIGNLHLRSPWKTFNQILTMEQLAKLRQHGSMARLLHKLRAEFRNLVLSSETSNFKTGPQGQTAIAEKAVALEHERNDTFVLASAALSPKQYLYTLLILRL